MPQEAAGTGDEKVYENLSKYFNMSNLNLKELNITADYLNDFIMRLFKLSNQQKLRQHVDGDGFQKPYFPIELIKQFTGSGFNNSNNSDKSLSSALSPMSPFDDSIIVRNNNIFSNIYSPSSSVLNAVDCDCYCGGMWRETLLEYKTIHGYIALLVSVTRTSQPASQPAS